MNRSIVAATLSPTRAAHKPLAIADGTLEAIKWLALVLMTLDHVNKYLLDHTQPLLFALGRIAMPLFVFVLAYNLARPGAQREGVFRRVATRLALYGALACVPFIALGKVYGSWWPLNILITLLVATLVIGLLTRGGRRQTTAAIVVFIVGGGLVEYCWFAVGLALVCWRYCKRPHAINLIALIGAFATLWLVNRSPWAFGALPMLLAAPRVTCSLPRRSLFFYVYYPAHLGVLFVLSTLLR